MNHPDEPDTRYSMGVVTRRTGLSPDVLRVWERRYAVVSPTRSDGGQRLYSAADIEKLRLLQRLVEGGHRIASVARLDLDALTALAREADAQVQDTPARGGSTDAILAELLAAVARLDAASIDQALRRSAMTLGTEAWIETVVGPMLESVGERWHDGTISPAHEHLATVAARDAMSWVVRSFGTSSEGPSILVATPAGEQHELGAMMAAVVAAESGWRVHYLGPDVPSRDLAAAARQLHVQAIALSVVHPDNTERTIDEVRQLRKATAASIPIIIGGRAAADAAAELTGAGATVVTDTRVLRGELAAVTPSA